MFFFFLPISWNGWITGANGPIKLFDLKIEMILYTKAKKKKKTDDHIRKRNYNNRKRYLSKPVGI
jgi:hypothetical protein